MELHGEHVTLQSVSLEVVPDLLPAFNGDAQFNVWSGYPTGIDLVTASADMQETLAMPKGSVWRIADSVGNLVGVAETAHAATPAMAWIALLLIRHEHQGHGYGGEAAELLEQHLFADPTITRIGLAVLVHNASAIAFWEKRGYAREVSDSDNHGHDVYRYSLSRPLLGTADTS